MWDNPKGFEKDVFTFTRIRYTSARGYGRRSRGGWETDMPDSDLNLSYRLQQMTSVKVDPDGRIRFNGHDELGAEKNGGLFLQRLRKGVQSSAIGHAPELHGTVRAGAGEHFAVWSKSQAIDTAIVTLEELDFSPVGYIPKADFLVVASGHQNFAIRR